jgi:hypothetical protein
LIQKCFSQNDENIHKKIKIKNKYKYLLLSDPFPDKMATRDHSLVCKKLTYPLHRLYPKTNHKTLTFHLPLLPQHGAAFGVLCMVKALGCGLFYTIRSNASKPLK